MLDLGADFLTARSGWLLGLVRPLAGLERNLAKSLGARDFCTGLTSLIRLAKVAPPFGWCGESIAMLGDLQGFAAAIGDSARRPEPRDNSGSRFLLKRRRRHHGKGGRAGAA